MEKTNSKRGTNHKILSFLRDNRTVIFFVLKLAAAWILWKLFILLVGQESDPIPNRPWPWFSEHWELFNDWIRILLLKSTALTLQIFGFSTHIYNDYVVKIDGYCGVGVGNYCLGLQLWFIMAALILLYPYARFYIRLIFAISGVFLINILNIIRLVTLSICTMYLSPEQLDFNHDFIFNVVVYIFMFLFYLWFIRKFGSYTKSNSTRNSLSGATEN